MWRCCSANWFRRVPCAKYPLKSCEGKLQHLGLESEPKRATLSYANAHRPWPLFERLFYDMLAQCQAVSPQKKFRFKNKLLSLDSTTVELCASLFDWARWRQTKGHQAASALGP
ncbi:MAG: hypothetical protein ABSF38_08285 [Verrucomicrobiota bacterium]